MSASILDVLNALGPDKVTFQLLSQTLTGQQKVAKDGLIHYTIATDQPLYDVVITRKKDAVIIWVDREEFMQEVKKAQAAGG